MAKRSRIDIIEDMLAFLSSRRGSKPTHLMYKSNLSHTQMKSYLDELLSKGFIRKETEKNHEMIFITPLGVSFLEKIREMKRFEEAFGLGN